MINKNNNYRIMKFFEPINIRDKAKGYVRLDIRGTRGNIIVSVENLGDVKTASEAYLFKDKSNKIKVGDINNKRGTIKKILTFGEDSAIEDYNICGIVKDKKIVLFACLYNPVNKSEVSKLDMSFEVKNINDAEVEEKAENNEYLHKTTDDNIEEQDDTVTENQNDIYTESDLAVIKDNSDFEISNNKPEDNLSKTDDENGEPEANDAAEALGRKINYKSKFEENLYKILDSYKKLEPLSVRIKDLTWWELPFNDKGFKNGYLPYYNQIVSSYYPYPVSNRVTTCNSLMKKYGHYIFGVFKQNGDITRFVYGIPGEFKREEQPYKGVTGFKNWSYKNKNREGDYGYWLAFVDAITGDVTEPPQIVLR